VGVVRDFQSIMSSSSIQPGKLRELIPDYVELVRAKNKPGSTHADQVAYVLTRDIDRLGIRFTNELDSKALDRLVRLYGTHTSTLKKAICVIKTFLRWVRRSRLAVDEWVFEYQAPKHVSEERIAWNDEQIQSLLRECDRPSLASTLPSGRGLGKGSKESMERMSSTRDYLTRAALRPALILMLRFAPRPIEVCKLVVANWVSSDRTLYLPGKITKNRRPRDFLVDAETAAMLDGVAQGRSPTEPLFLSYKGRQFTSQHLTKLIKELVERARLPGTAYCCRHTATSRLIQLAKGDLPLVQSITGHRTLSELQRYVHATKDRRAAVVDALNEAAQGGNPAIPEV